MSRVPYLPFKTRLNEEIDKHFKKLREQPYPVEIINYLVQADKGMKIEFAKSFNKIQKDITFDIVMRVIDDMSFYVSDTHLDHILHETLYYVHNNSIKYFIEAMKKKDISQRF